MRKFWLFDHKSTAANVAGRFRTVFEELIQRFEYAALAMEAYCHSHKVNVSGRR
jgi:hypothetical protein